MQLARLVEVSEAVTATRARTTKRDLIAELLTELLTELPTEVEADQLEIATAWLSGVLRQRRTGVGWRGLSSLPPPAASADPELDLVEIDAVLEEVSLLSGPGSALARGEAIRTLFARLTAPEQAFLRAVMTGAVRQGALDSVMLDAIAKAAGLPLAAVRRAAMFSAPTGPVARAALTGGLSALDDFSLRVGRPIRPMLASSAPDIDEAAARLSDTFCGTFVVDTKLDGIRIQVHKDGADVRVFTRSLDEISARLPDVVGAVRSLPAQRLILDGEALTVDEHGSPRPFQDTASATASGSRTGSSTGIVPFFFDLLLVDEEGLLDEPTAHRLERLDAVVPQRMRTPRLVTDDVAAAREFFAARLAEHQEGVILKRLDSPYEAGRRGAGWIKVKPRHTLDLVVLAVEWGSGRRRGLLSNIHLGARGPDGTWVMLGKTFKGMTDQMLTWQTERFLALETGRDGHVVHLRPEQVVEIAFDGLQRSTRYPGGVALRFARVLRYRDDKSVAEADTIESVRSLFR